MNASASAAETQPSVPTANLRLRRAEVPPASTWDLSDLYADDAAWQADAAQVDADSRALEPWRGRVLDHAAGLYALLTAYDALHGRLMRVSTYAYLRNAEDGTEPANQARVAQVAALQARVEARLSFFESELMALNEDTLRLWLKDVPGLAVYADWLREQLAQQPHRLGAECEQVLAALGPVLNAPYMTYLRSKSGDWRFAPFADASGQPVENSVNAFESRWETHPDPQLRRAAWQSFTQGLVAMQHSCAATFSTEVTKQVTLAQLRRFPSTEAALLHEHRLPVDVMHRVVDVVMQELAPPMQRLARLRKRVLGLDTLLPCDLKAPLDGATTASMDIDRAGTLILQALEVMGPEYGALMRRALSERWIDAADNIGKSSGAFCASPHGVHPFLLITWSNTMRNVFTLAHELGHAGHFGLAMQAQPWINLRPALPFIEAPSILNELLLARHLLATTSDPLLRRSVILQVLGTFHHNFVTHLLEAELQRRVIAHAEAGGAITADYLNDCKGRILEAFWGDTVQIDDGARRTWMRQPHYYMGLYPYTYAVGLVASVALMQRIEREGDAAVQDWLGALKAGGTQSPMALLQVAGVDLRTPAPIQAAVAYAAALIDELESLFP